MDKKSIILKILCVLLLITNASLVYGTAKSASNELDNKDKPEEFKRFYITIKGGYAMDQNLRTIQDGGQVNHSYLSMDNGPVGMAAFGVTFSDIFRSELETSYDFGRGYTILASNSDFQSTTITSTTLMSNSYISIPNRCITSYFMLGAGASFNKTANWMDFQSNMINPAQSNTTFAWQLGGGLSIKHQNLNLDTEIRYVFRGNAISTDLVGKVNQISLKDIIFLTSLRMNF